MVVAKNCLLAFNQSFNLDDIKKIVENHIYPNLYKFLQVAISIPISSATCEHFISSMRRLQNWMRSSVLQNRFSDLAIINIERFIVYSLNV